MQSISKPKRTALLAALLVIFALAAAGDPNLEQKLAAKYALTTINAEGGVVTQGVVLTLRKNGFIADPIKKCSNDYKEGRIGLGGNVLLRAACAKVPGSTVRSFVAGEKLSITRIEVKDGVIFGLISDPIGDQRYKADLKFSVGKGAYIDFATAEQMISDAFAIAPADNQQQTNQQQVNQQQVSQQGGQQQGVQPAPPPPPAEPTPAPLPDIPPPPPPPDQPAAPAAPAAPTQTLSLGLTVDQVIAILGQPATIVDLGAKKIYTFKNQNLKVIFVNGKATDIQ